jgi:WD40 repeat protein
VRAFDVTRGLDQGGFAGHTAYNAVAAYYPRDGWMALGGLDGTVKVWDPLAREALATLAAHRLQVRALAFSDDGRLLATAGEEGGVRVWDWEARQEVAAFDDDQIAETLRFAPDAGQLAVGTREVIRLYPLAAGGQTLTLNAGLGGTSVLAYAPGGAYLVSGGGEDDFSLWNPQSGALVARLTGSGGQRASAVFAPDGTMLLTSAMGGLTALWNMTTITAQTVNSAPINTGGASIFDVDWTGDQRLLTLFGARGAVQVWGIGPETGG